MTSIGRINTTITDHSIIASTLAVCAIVLGVSVLNAAAYQNGDLAKTYDNLLQPFTTTQAPVNETTTSRVQTTPEVSSTALTISKTAPLSLQNQPVDVVGDLQPAQTTKLGTTASVSYFHPSVNNMQLTSGPELQNATASIQ